MFIICPDYYSVQKIKKMLSIIARIAPYRQNIQKLAGQTGTTRDTLLKYLFYLEKAQVVKWLSRDTFDRFLDYFGLIQIETERKWDADKFITKTDLLDRLFKIQPHRSGKFA